VERGLAALGGVDAARALPGFTLRARSKATQLDQNPSPERPFATDQVDETIVVDARGGRAYVEFASKGAGYSWGATRLLDGAEAYRLGSAQQRAVRRLPSSDVDELRRLGRRLPHFLLLEALDRAHTLRLVGEEPYRDRPHRVVSVAFADGASWTLHFDAQSGLLSKHEYLETDATYGDVLVEAAYKDHRELGKTRVPTGVVTRRGADVSRDTDYIEIQLDGDFAGDARLRVPEGWEVRPAHPERPANFVRRVAQDVYMIENVGGSQEQNVMAVGFDGFVLVVDAPEDRPHAGFSEAVIAAIRKTLPGREIRYVAPTHHHVDHGAGLRAYIAEGATVVTTPGNAEFVRRIAKAPYVIRPDALARKPREPKIELIDGKVRKITDGTRVVELHDIGPEPHARENVAAWLPKERILFLADLFETGWGETQPWDGSGFLGDLLKRYEWDVATVVTAHSLPRQMADMRAKPASTGAASR
jgi:glyoxylase-like metal-dependent hydrolase (beta-lactamase superfamily II)